jgi:hypothetical protein
VSRLGRVFFPRHRGYGTRTDYFDGFPDDARWQWMAISPAELARVRYIDYDYWVELSGGTRLAVAAAARIRASDLTPPSRLSEVMALACSAGRDRRMPAGKSQLGQRRSKPAARLGTYPMDRAWRQARACGCLRPGTSRCRRR